MSRALFEPVFVPDALREATGDTAWLGAMLEAEGALAVALARAGLVPEAEAEEIRRCCEADRFADRLDPEELGREGRAAGNPVVPLVQALTEAVSGVSEEAARHVHWGATSQDILDTAAMLVARRSLDLVLADLDGLAAALAWLAREHRGTVMAGRTLMQQALPTTFGLKAAGWLVPVLEARRSLLDLRRSGLAAQLGGAAGTLASLGNSGLPVLREFAQELDLAEPPIPWHTARWRVAELGNTLALCSGTLHKLAVDVILLSQTEVGEVAEPSGGAGSPRGGSSTLPHKRNPILSTTTAANAQRVAGLAATLQGSMAAEHERAAGRWHAEWEVLSDALALTGGATAAMREAMEGLEVHPEKMRANLDATGGIVLAENVTTLAAGHLGRAEAHELVEAACRRALERGTHLREEVLAEPVLQRILSPEEVEAALDPEGYLGSAAGLVDRALELYDTEVSS
ncbi:MAG: 3-carboxy-cis,cis-muconate cycloisomerase [Rubrobacter sp.]|nr:3-carboxy-cis,cis-muconate cycloisomerase [Rubrobacter sp.]